MSVPRLRVFETMARNLPENLEALLDLCLAMRRYLEVMTKTLEDLANSIDICARSRQYGVYLQDQMKIAGKWVVSLGGRQDWVRSGSTRFFGNLPWQNSNDQALTGRVGLIYLADNGIAPFLSYSSSFEPQSGVDRQGNRFSPTTGQQFEAGIRYQPNEDTLVSAVVYQLAKQNVLTPDPAAPTTDSVQTGEIRSRGFELEAKSRIGRNIGVMTAYTYTDAKTTRSNNPAEVGVSAGAVPHHQASVWGDYEFTNAGLAGLKLGSGVRYVGPTTIVGGGVALVPDYVVMDALASFSFSKWTLAVNATNLLDKTDVMGWTAPAVQQVSEC